MEKGVKISDVNNILYHKNIRGNEKIPISSGQNIPQVVTTEELKNYIKEDIEGSGEENIIEKITFNGQEATVNEATKTAEITYTPPSEKDPTVPSHVKSITLQDINNWNLKQDNITDLDEIRNNALLGKDAYQKPSTGIPKSDLSQEVQNLLDNPSITAETDPIYSQSPAAIITYEDIGHWNSKSDFSGNYNDLYNKPTIPSAQIQSDWNQTNTNAKDYIKNKPNIPQGVVVDNALSSTSENPVQNKVINSALSNKVDSANLATVATSGSYNDLSNKPTIPIVPTNISGFTNDAGYVTSSDIPTKISELTNDSGFITSHQDISGKADKSEMNVTTNGDMTTITLKSGTSAMVINQHQDISGKVNTSDLSTVATSGNYNDLSNKPIIPNELSDLSDDSTHRLVTDTEKSTWNAKQSALAFDTTPTANSTNPVTSAGIKAYVDNATPTITMDDTPTSGSNNPVKSGGIYNSLQGKQNTLTFDSTPTTSSSNPVTSGGVKDALDLKANQSTTYTKTEVDGLLEDVAILADDDGQATTLTFDPQADTVWNKAQTLGSAQQAQARNNIGAVGSVTVNGTTYTPTNGNVDLGTISGGGGSVTVDSTLSTSSTNPVQNSAITTALNGKVGSSTITSIVSLTEAAYTALATKDASTLYVIIES